MTGMTFERRLEVDVTRSIPALTYCRERPDPPSTRLGETSRASDRKQFTNEIDTCSPADDAPGWAPQRGCRAGVEEGCRAGRMQTGFHQGLLCVPGR
jgi:hypothetical protein